MLNKLELFADKHNMFPNNGRILVAFSGGADSLCLLTALIELSEKRSFTVAAAHFNHQLRGEESERDALFVERFCFDRNIALHTGCGNVAEFAHDNHIGIEEAARSMRYDFLYESANILGASRIATAHTADDNAETVLLNLARGAGLKGLSGIPPVRDIIIRPMLTIKRTNVISFLAVRSLSFVEDSSNMLDIYSRNLLRHRVIPVLKEINPRLIENISSSSLLLKEDDDFLTSIAKKYIEENRQGDTLNAHKLAKLERPISGRIVRLMAPNILSSKHINAVLELCQSAKVSGEVALPSCSVYREYDKIVFPRSPNLSGFAPVELIVGAQTEIPELGLRVSCKKTVCGDKINKSFTSFLFKYDTICDKIVVRNRETGDKIELFGCNGTKSLKKLFIEKRIPVRKRPLVPVITDNKGVLAVCGIGFDKRAACKPGDTVLAIIFEETSNE